MPAPSPLNPLAASFLQQLVRATQELGIHTRDTGEVGGGFMAIPDPSGPFTIRRRPGPTTLNDMVSGMFTLPGNRGIQTQLLQMLGNALQPNTPLAALGSFNPQLPRASQFPEFVVPMLRQSR